MSNHPLNLVFRFALELAMLTAWGVAGWALGGEGFGRWLPALLLPLAAAALWGVFRVPGDGGPPVIAVGGRLRLLLEFALFAGAVAALWAAARIPFAATLGGLTLLHYLLSWDRVRAFLI